MKIKLNGASGLLWVVFGLIITVGGITFITETKESLDREAEVKQAAAEHEAAVERQRNTEAKLKALPPSEHLTSMQAALDGMRKTGYNAVAANTIESRLSYIPKGDPSYRRAEAIIGDLHGMKKAVDAKRLSERKAAETKRLAEAKQEERKQYAEWHKLGVDIGMTADRASHSSWGRPSSINRSVYGDQVEREQWCYGGGNFLYFENGILTAIQTGS